MVCPLTCVLHEAHLRDIPLRPGTGEHGAAGLSIDRHHIAVPQHVLLTARGFEEGAH